MFYFVTKRIPYLCGFWRFANAYAENRDERSESERPSVLADLKSKAEHIPPAKYSETREEVL